ncbi:polysaccharide deacetylase family protein [Selenihalanaerobacter shriftii]|uniref:Polysaccharide deacetylase family sporulation protein PdaB n=1 Tax=Selenihalanaerobacter shriftii TaxID=142842 RepID=A0A1T4JNP6_9FIRM|nr:polysaccharide deacetylase family protein [Selenihalanaerobacter shriftii]SJZ31697.1 polysaccharide deacetylase family sporulation protein PdaB [Selenihalanaerobacter shriftii]
MFNKKIKFYFIPLHRGVLLGILFLLIAISFLANSFMNEVEPVFNEVKPYYHGSEDKAEMALTINVAWGQEHIPQMLKVLKEKEVKATFFFIGRWVEKFPELTKQIAEGGHEIGNHGYRHSHPNQLSKQALTNLIKKNEELLIEVTGHQTKLFAPPYGEYNDRVVKIADDLGYRTILWTADTIDWQRPAPEVIISRITKKASNGGIVLMHPTAPTAKSLPTMIDKLRKEGYELVTVTQLLMGQGD